MTYKQIEASRETRLWIGQIIVPALTLATSVLAIPEVREAVSEKLKGMKYSVRKRFRKG